jgi:hypothetical protein
MVTHTTKRHASHKRSRSGRKKPMVKIALSDRPPRPYGPALTLADDPRYETRNHPNPQRDLPNLQKRAYSGRILSLVVSENTKAAISSKVIPAEWQSLMNPVEDCLTEYSLLKFLNKYLVILDKAFFFGTMKPMLRGFVIYSEQTSKAGFYHERDRTIHINQIFYARNPEDPPRRHLETLAHEMLHAFLYYYTCQCGKCGQHVGNSDIRGATGHGTIWANAMINIQKAITRDLGWEADCNIEASIMNEIKASGWKPRLDQLERWECKHLIAKELAKEGGRAAPRSQSGNHHSKTSSRSRCCAVM